MDPATHAVLAPFLGEPPADAWLRDVLLSYGRYLVRVLSNHIPTAEAEVLLRDDLLPLAGISLDKLLSLDDLEEALATHFRERGLYFLGGQTLPYYGPYIWKRMESKEFSVELPNGSQEVVVHFLHEFLLCGWHHFHSYGKSSAGGWAKWGEANWPDGLYCVYDAWKMKNGLDSQKFQVSLLKHEAQHLSDFQKFPSLTPVNLEYRAKLVELIYLSSLEDRFLWFLQDANDDPDAPHPQAAHRIIADLSRRLFNVEYVSEEEKWRGIKYEQIQDMARLLLSENSKALETQGQ